jgi:hypothetical protein
MFITKCPNERNAISEPISSPIAIIAIPSTAAAKINYQNKKNSRNDENLYKP